MDRQETAWKKTKRLTAGLSGVAAVLIALGAGCASEQPQVQVQTENGAPVEVTPVPASSTEPPTPGASSYKDGTYTARGDYFTHAGPESVDITLTLKGGVVTDSKFQANPNEQESGFYMQMFADNYKPMVIGKSIDDLNLTKVSGSSLTPMGFNDAVAKIKAQAKA